MGDVGDSERLLRTCGRSAATFWVFGTFQYPGRHFSVFGHSLESNELGSPRAVHRQEEPAYRHGEPRGRSGKKDQSEVRGRSGTTGNQSEGGHAGVGKCPGTLRPLRGALPPRWGGAARFFFVSITEPRAFETCKFSLAGIIFLAPSKQRGSPLRFPRPVSQPTQQLLELRADLLGNVGRGIRQRGARNVDADKAATLECAISARVSSRSRGSLGPEIQA